MVGEFGFNPTLMLSERFSQFLLPSLWQTAECGHKYLLVVGYDEGDRVFDDVEAQSLLDGWIKVGGSLFRGYLDTLLLRSRQSYIYAYHVCTSHP